MKIKIKIKISYPVRMNENMNLLAVHWALKSNPEGMMETQLTIKFFK
jgi:hypothetical protein